MCPVLGPSSGRGDVGAAHPGTAGRVGGGEQRRFGGQRRPSCLLVPGGPCHDRDDGRRLPAGIPRRPTAGRRLSPPVRAASTTVAAARRRRRERRRAMPSPLPGPGRSGAGALPGGWPRPRKATRPRRSAWSSPCSASSASTSLPPASPSRRSTPAPPWRRSPTRLRLRPAGPPPRAPGGRVEARRAHRRPPRRRSRRRSGAAGVPLRRRLPPRPECAPVAHRPARRRRRRGDKLRSWLLGALPDDPAVLDALCVERGADRRDPLGLLAGPMGADCAGAVQFCPPDRAGALLADPGGADPIGDEAIADWLDRMGTDPARRAYLADGADAGFSIGGMQPKAALRRTASGGWAVPRGSLPTTHLVKASRPHRWPHEALIEHLTMRAAAGCGIPAARTETCLMAGREVIVVERYDRAAGGTVRVHQEDMCQVLGVPPRLKYQRNGGPGVEEIAGVLRAADPDRADENIERLCDVLFVPMGGGEHRRARQELRGAPPRRWQRAPRPPLRRLFLAAVPQRPIREENPDSREARSRLQPGGPPTRQTRCAEPPGGSA